MLTRIRHLKVSMFSDKKSSLKTFKFLENSTMNISQWTEHQSFNRIEVCHWIILLNLVEMTLRSAARPRWHSQGTRRTLAFHLGHSRVTCVSLQLHFLFTCSSLIHTSFTYGSLCQQGVQWVIHNWLIRAWRPAFTKHSLILWISAKALPILVTSLSLEMPHSPSRFR